MLIVENERFQEISLVSDTVDFIYESKDRISENYQEVLGMIVFFFAIREFGREGDKTGRVLTTAFRALDSYGPEVTEDITRGIERMREELFDVRGQSHSTIVTKSFDYLAIQGKRLGLILLDSTKA